MNSTVFLGGGRIASALIAGLRLCNYKNPIVVHDKSAAKLRRLRRDFRVRTEPNLERAVEDAAVIILAVRPDAARKLIADVAGPIRARVEGSRTPLIVISVMAGIPLEWLRKSLPADVSLARVMPSPLCDIRRGLTAIVFDRNCRKDCRKKVREFFGGFGSILELPEKQFNAFTVTYSSSHGLHALSALADAGVSVGLDRKMAEFAAAHALGDSIAALREGKVDLRQMLKAAATPGGIAEKTMAVMDQSGYRTAVLNGVRRGYKHACKMEPPKK
jgi:pyrroline-5-carboxylate reductase